MHGPDRAGFLHRVCTAHVENLAAGQHAWTCLLSPKGRVVSFFDVWAGPDHFLLLMEPVLAETTQATLGKYALMDNVEIFSSTARVHRVWDAPESVWTAPPVFAAAQNPASREQAEVRRIEAGFPSYGKDVTTDHFVFESGLERFVDHKKGCYIGQEPVARVRDRGEPQKMLRGLRLAAGAPPLPGASIIGAERKVAGSVTSSAFSPDFGAIALGYIARSSWDIGTKVEVEGQLATVSSLPFAR
jgi:folate-binding protein YgfZ